MKSITTHRRLIEATSFLEKFVLLFDEFRTAGEKDLEEIVIIKLDAHHGDVEDWLKKPQTEQGELEFRARPKDFF